MKQTINQILKAPQDGKSVTLAGWVKTKRESKKFAFLVVNDGSTQGDLQCIVDADTPAFGLLADCATGAAITITGVLKQSPGAGQAWELKVDRLEVLGKADPETYPLQKKGHTLEFLREIGHLRGRTNTFGAVYRVRNSLSMLVHKFFQERDFFWVHTPILTANDCEGAGEMFTVTTMDLNNLPKTPQGKVDHSKDFFGKHTHLTVSGQLEGEALAMALGNIYTFGPTFRAENSNTTRHLAEFWMIEPEMAFADLKDLMILAEDFLRYIFAGIVNSCEDELAFLSKQYEGSSPKDIATLAEQSFAKIRYTDAVTELKKHNDTFEFKVEWGCDLQTEHERFLTDKVFNRPVIVTDYPKDIKAFYMKVNGDGRTVAAMDVLAPRIGEIIGGSQREDKLDLLQARMASMNIPQDDMQWYLDLRRFGGAQHAGFGLGFERLVQYITGMGNIRDTIPFPRFPGGIAF